MVKTCRGNIGKLAMLKKVKNAMAKWKVNFHREKKEVKTQIAMVL